MSKREICIEAFVEKETLLLKRKTSRKITKDFFLQSGKQVLKDTSGVTMLSIVAGMILGVQNNNSALHVSFPSVIPDNV